MDNIDNIIKTIKVGNTTYNIQDNVQKTYISAYGVSANWQYWKFANQTFIACYQKEWLPAEYYTAQTNWGGALAIRISFRFDLPFSINKAYGAIGKVMADGLMSSGFTGYQAVLESSNEALIYFYRESVQSAGAIAVSFLCTGEYSL